MVSEGERERARGTVFRTIEKLFTCQFSGTVGESFPVVGPPAVNKGALKHTHTQALTHGYRYTLTALVHLYTYEVKKTVIIFYIEKDELLSFTNSFKKKKSFMTDL